MWTRATLAVMALAASTMVSPAAAGPGKHSLRVVVHGVKKKIRAADGIDLRAKLQWRGPKAEFAYRWSADTGPALPYGTDRNGERLVIKADELSAGDTYHLRLDVTATYPDPEDDTVTLTAKAASAVTIAVNAPPTGGDCTMEVTWHGPAQASLIMEAGGWSDDDDKLQYKFKLVRNGKEFVAHNWSRNNKYATASLAKPGDELQTKCIVRDDLGDTTEAVSKLVKRTQ